MSNPRFDPAEFARTMERMAAGRDHGQTPMRPGFDPALHREVKADAIAGRKIGDYQQALEALGFAFFPAKALRPYPDGSRHAEGEWRCQGPPRMAFTESDILTMFPGGPGELYTWAQGQRTKWRAAKSRIVIP